MYKFVFLRLLPLQGAERSHNIFAGINTFLTERLTERKMFNCLYDR